MKRVETIITDDISGAHGASTVYFSFEGRAYEIDLVDDHRNELLFTLRPWIDAARPRRMSYETAERRKRLNGNGHGR